jgi:hypothetical protein
LHFFGGYIQSERTHRCPQAAVHFEYGQLFE